MLLIALIDCGQDQIYRFTQPMCSTQVTCCVDWVSTFPIYFCQTQQNVDDISFLPHFIKDAQALFEQSQAALYVTAYQRDVAKRDQCEGAPTTVIEFTTNS